MFTNSKLAKSIRLAMAVGAVSTIYSAGAIAQDSEAEALESVEKISVTGSRIRSANLTSASPLQIISSVDIDTSGVANIQDLLLDNPAFGTPAISRTNSNFSTASAGIATVDLRDLGTNRTLVLINGRRVVSGQPGQSAVDLNNIPAQFVERIEILTGGASSVYGSDAVAGVVNVVLKKEFEGVEVEAQYGESAEGDNTERQISITSGVNSDKGNMMFHIGYTDQGAVYSRDRDRSAVDQADTFAFFTGDPTDYGTATSPFFSSFPPQGRFDSANNRWTYDSNNQLQDTFSTNGPNGDGVDANGFNRSAYRSIAIPTERYLFSSKGDYELSDNHKVFFEATYASSQTTTELEPFPFASDNIYSSGAVPLEFRVDGAILANPYVPADILADATVNSDGLRELDFFAKRLLDVGSRGNVADRDNFRFVVGMEGEIADGWYYDIYYDYGTTKEAQVSSGQVNVLNFRRALEAIPDVNDIDGDGNVSEAICLDETSRDFGCVPVNIYGLNSITPEAADWINAPGLLSTYASQEIIGGSITGEVFELPAGSVGIAVGFEHREEFSRSEFDALQQKGLNAGNAIPRTEGEFDVTEAFLEANIPVLETVNIRGAVRASDYSTVGNTVSWNIGFEWEIMEDLRFRAISAESTRAPNIDELFAPPGQTFPSGLVDPCVGVTSASSGAGAATCLADPGVLSNIALNGSHTLSQSDLQGISGFNAGNPDVSEEVGKSTTLGLVWSPSKGMFENLGVTLDYFDIEIEDAIVSTPRQFILDQCYGGGDQQFCDFVIRRPSAIGNNSAGSIEFINSGVSNSGEKTVEGVDLTVTYSVDIGPGTLNTRLAYTYLIDGFDVPLPGADKDVFVGEITTSEHKGFLNLGYSVDDFNITLRTTYIGSASEDDQFLAGYDLAPGAISIGSEIYADMQVSYHLSDVVEIYGGVDNLFDNEPPKILTGTPFSDTGTETAAGTYDPIGQRYYVGVRARF